ncbi:hypothetical protein MKW94_029544 [Papaver nudicaule]|uniref:Uncharacterized protein n=1 Tax=Papaver nudicaule TaxID=74823 RepID=A0AA41RX95_PAPNU|nr:hypothetical protein [Papaver nudicaule]
MSGLITQVTALGLLCLLLLGFSYFVDAAARPITDDARPLEDEHGCIGPCANNDECDKKCRSLGHPGGICFRHPAASSSCEEKIDVNMFGIITIKDCCCFRRPQLS